MGMAGAGLAFGLAGLALVGASFGAPVPAQTRAPELRIETLADGLEHPWGLAVLPDGRFLVTERPGRLRLVREGTLSAPIGGLPALVARSQGGLLDVALARDFASTGTIFLCHAVEGEPMLATALSRARLVETAEGARLEDVRTLFRQQPATSRGLHFGCRIVPLPDGTVVLTLGDHFQHARQAQVLSNTVGKIVRLTADGAIPPDNPFVGRAGVDPAIYSYGHRNVQGATLGPDGALWVAEHGARGGDEINRVLPGRNYGWPVVTHALDYSGAVIARETSRPGMDDPVHYWTSQDTIAPSGAAFVTGPLFRAWQGDLLVGGLRSALLMRLRFRDGRFVEEERLLRDLNARIRDVRMAPDGAILLLTDSPRGRLLRVTPRG